MNIIRMVLCVFAACVAAGAHAQNWPARPVKFFIGSAPGSGPDVNLRLLSDRLSKMWGQSVVIENRPGAGGIAGTAAAASAPADGYNFLYGLTSALAMNQYLLKSMPFDPEKDLVPVVGAGVTPMVIAVNPSLPVTSIAQLIALAKSQPGKVTVGTTSKTAAHLTIASFAATAGVEFLHAHYKSAPNALQDMMAGQVQVFSDALAAIPNFKDPKVRILALTYPKRLPNMPDIPVVAETLPGFVSYGWYAIMAPTGTPADAIARVNRDVNTAVNTPELATRLRDLGTYDAGGTPEQLDRFIRAERERLRNAVAAAKIEKE